MNALQESLKDLSNRVFEKLQAEGVQFALAGGLVADLYRSEPRGTGDIDVVVSLDSSDALKAQRIVEELGFQATIVTEAQLKGDTRLKRASKRSPAQIVVGRKSGALFGVDLILLSLPWAQQALEHAQSHRVDFGLPEPVPTLIVEDLVIAKLYAIKNNSKRRITKFDIPDVATILDERGDELDINYLSDVMLDLELVLPRAVEQFSNYRLVRIGKKLRKQNKVVFDY